MKLQNFIFGENENLKKINYYKNSFNNSKKIKNFKKNYSSYSKCDWEKLFIIEEDSLEYLLSSKDEETMGYCSAYGSRYWYTKEYLYRLSNHWGSVASCYWALDGSENLSSEDYCLARVKWDDIEFIPKVERNPFYLFRDLPEEKKEKLIQQGLVSSEYDWLDDRTNYDILCSYTELEKAISRL